MIAGFCRKIAGEMGINLTDISLVNGARLGCTDAHLLKLTSNDRLACILVYQSDLDTLNANSTNILLVHRISSALTRLKCD